MTWGYAPYKTRISGPDGLLSTNGWLQYFNTLDALLSRLSSSSGGVVTNASALTAHAPVVGAGGSAIATTAAMANGQILIGRTGSDPAPLSVSGDALLNSLGVLTLADTAVTPGAYTNTNLTVDSKGRITVAASGNNPGYNYLSGPDATASFTTTHVLTVQIGSNSYFMPLQLISIELREDATLELREDGGYELRE